MKKGQIFSLDFILSMVIVMLAFGLLVQFAGPAQILLVFSLCVAQAVLGDEDVIG